MIYMILQFPAERIPDNAIFAPHHYYLGVVLCLFVCLIVWDNYRSREPWLVMAISIAGLIAFGLTWPYYPVTGAIVSIATPILAMFALLTRREYWSDIKHIPQILIFIGLLIALDDAVDHALPLTTPLEYLAQYLLPLIP